MREYDMVRSRLARGWNQWNTWSLVSQVLMPEGFELNLAFRDNMDGRYLERVLLGRSDVSGREDVEPGIRTIDGAYTSLVLRWRNGAVRIETADLDGDLLVLLTPLEMPSIPHTVFVQAGMLWNRPGIITLNGSAIRAVLSERTIDVRGDGERREELNIPAAGPYLSYLLSGPVAIYAGSGRPMGTADARAFMDEARSHVLTGLSRYGRLAECAEGIGSVVAWDTVWEPAKGRVVSPVSRYWSADLHGGYVLFCWDSFFAATLASLGSRELAYANAVEITKEILDAGYVAIMNCPLPRGTDRSQPPVGAMTVMGLYGKYRDRWLLEHLFDDLFRWNGWWLENREVGTGLLAWGYDPVGTTSSNAALESGLDNSPMYDDIPFDAERGVMLLADVGLCSLHAMDSRLLARMARILGRESEGRILDERAARCEAALETLWDEDRGLYFNRNMATGEFDRRVSPTLFYPLLTGTVARDRALRMVREHYFKPEEFYGEWMLPSIARNDPAYPDQNYWRGRVWAPLNWLVYLGFRRSGLTEAAKDLAEKSERLFLKEWRERRHVHENYNADTGEGCPDGKNTAGSDPYYHWGALLALIPLLESGAASFDPWFDDGAAAPAAPVGGGAQ